MNDTTSSSSSAVPSIRIHDADESALFDSSVVFSSEFFSVCDVIPEATTLYPCSQGSQSEYVPSSIAPNSSAELDEISEFSHLTTMNPVYLTDVGYANPYTTILQDNGTTSVDGGLFPSSLGSPIPSPTPSFGSSLSPSSLHDTFALSDSDSPLSPSPTTPDQFYWSSQGLNPQGTDSLEFHPSFTGSFSSDSVHLSDFLGPQAGFYRPRSKSSPSRSRPVASKAMLEANSRRRRHPAQFQCTECDQTFTAQFSLKRHEQSHSGNRPFECSIPGCTQRFFNSSDCKRHEKSKKRHKDL